MNNYRQKGFTLLELMLSISLSLVFVSMLVSMYQSYLHSENIQASISHLQQQTTSAFDMLVNETRKAGYIGCAKLTKEFPVAELPPFTINPSFIISSTTLTVRYVDFPGVTLLYPMPDLFTLEVSNYRRYRIGDVLVVSNCSYADIFQIKKVYFYKDKQTLIATKPLSHLYAPLAEIGKLIKHEFFVAQTQRDHLDGSPIFALYRRDLRGVSNAMVDDIEAMQLSVLAPQLIVIRLSVSSSLFKKDQFSYATHTL